MRFSFCFIRQKIKELNIYTFIYFYYIYCRIDIPETNLQPDHFTKEKNDIKLNINLCQRNKIKSYIYKHVLNLIISFSIFLNIFTKQTSI